MKPILFDCFEKPIEQASWWLQHRSKLVHSDHWQGSDIRDKPEMATQEVSHVTFSVNLGPVFDGLDHDRWLNALRGQIKPNLPWADDHFAERVCGAPINPGEEWKRWPYGHSAAKFLDPRGMFNHNYMERYWPRYAGTLQEPTLSYDDWLIKVQDARPADTDPPLAHRGIMYEYGDLNDVVALLAGDPYTRQAYLPIWFPEDTGGGSKRAPCTLGYHLMMREDKLDLDYHIRSCDFVRHFRDDIYLTMRLLLWVLEQCVQRDSRWANVKPGRFVMHIGSLHLFVNDFKQLFG